MAWESGEKMLEGFGWRNKISKIYSSFFTILIVQNFGQIYVEP